MPMNCARSLVSGSTKFKPWRTKSSRRPKRRKAFPANRRPTDNMKTILITIWASIGLTTAFAGQRFDAATWKNVQTYDVPTFLKQEASLIGKIVAVRFHYRSDKLRPFQPNWYDASIWQPD